MSSALLDIYGALNKVHRDLSSQLACSELGGTESLILVFLSRQGAMNPSALADALDLTRGRVTHLADSLQRDGLVERVVDPRDRRQVRLALTTAGAQQAQEAQVRLQDAHDNIQQRLGEQELLSLQRLLLALSAAA